MIFLPSSLWDWRKSIITCNHFCCSASQGNPRYFFPPSHRGSLPCMSMVVHSRYPSHLTVSVTAANGTGKEVNDFLYSNNSSTTIVIQHLGSGIIRVYSLAFLQGQYFNVVLNPSSEASHDGRERRSLYHLSCVKYNVSVEIILLHKEVHKRTWRREAYAS
jgi:hypothetical protein